MTNCFKAYDIRGKVPDELNPDIAYRIGIAYAKQIKPSCVIIGYDARLESIALTEALIAGLNSEGVRVINIGLCGTEEVYFHTFDREKNKDVKVEGGIMVTASHNPKGYNGMKLVGEGSKPISNDTGLLQMREAVEAMQEIKYAPTYVNDTLVINHSEKDRYIEHLLSYINLDNLKALKLVVNPGNGTAGEVLKLLEHHLPFKFIYLQETPDGHFPNGVPNPLLRENQQITVEAVKANNADLGIAWDGDFDRCFLFDEGGNFIEGYYIVGLLAAAFLKKKPGSKIIHDPRLIWNTIDIVNKSEGIPIMSKTGHAFIKERMRMEDAIYGGEMSAHHYFKDFAYCDSGMIPWLLIAELISLQGRPLSEIVKDMIRAYPCSGEINYKVNDAPAILKAIHDHFVSLNPNIDYTDGMSMEFTDWRFNLRSSNTEPLLRLNIETKSNLTLLNEKMVELEQLILLEGNKTSMTN